MEDMLVLPLSSHCDTYTPNGAGTEVWQVSPPSPPDCLVSVNTLPTKHNIWWCDASYGCTDNLVTRPACEKTCFKKRCFVEFSFLCYRTTTQLDAQELQRCLGPSHHPLIVPEQLCVCVRRSVCLCERVCVGECVYGTSQFSCESIRASHHTRLLNWGKFRGFCGIPFQLWHRFFVTCCDVSQWCCFESCIVFLEYRTKGNVEDECHWCYSCWWSHWCYR